jgi:hypothetical protein
LGNPDRRAQVSRLVMGLAQRKDRKAAVPLFPR